MLKNCFIYRHDSIAIAYKWKKSLSFKQVQLIDEGCKDYYKYIGYEPVGSQQELSDPNNYHRTTLIPLTKSLIYKTRLRPDFLF
ncbi:hypothetical protein EB796_018431 [Bugula neritina]|uniref:Uncharacterized protein n=1 Tax=Bugula neritina TaxID=10212 RepID=A0A7J7JC73_BUGNE|nr:hypothetical protein EB796_018431 [Bugula neritina]